jgi:hypothetical protein
VLTLTGHADAQRHTDHSDEPHNHPNPVPTTHTQHVSATTEAAADSQPQARSRPLPAADSEEAAPSEPDPASTRSQSASPRLLESGRRNEGACGSTGKKTPGGAGTHTRHTEHADAQRHTDHITDHTDEPHNHRNPPTTHTSHVSATTEAATDSRVVDGGVTATGVLSRQRGNLITIGNTQ